MGKKKLFEKFIVPFFIFALTIFGIANYQSPNVGGAKNSFEISFLDVGQGDATLIKTPKQKLYLIDGGQTQSTVEELGKISSLNKTINGLFITHPHADHIAGLNYVLNSYKVEKIIMTNRSHTSPDYLELLKNIKKQNISSEEGYAYKQYLTDEVKIKILWPKMNSSFKNLNDSSLALLITYQNQNFLLLGDLSAEKQDIIAKENDLPSVGILKVAHHGSKTGLSKALFEEVNPKYSVISVGENDYGHPSTETLNKLQGSIILRTDERGTIRFFVNDGQLFLE